VRADALLLNYKSVLYTFVPDPARGVAQVLVEPPLAGHGGPQRCRCPPAPATTGAAR
jgi:hypothetical protein